MKNLTGALRVLFVSLAFSVAAVAPAFAKCPLIEWHVVGRVVSAKEKSPIEGAQVFVFLDESESTKSAGYGTTSPDYFLTSADGTYLAKSYFDSFQSWSMLRGDQCSKKPSLVEVVVVKEGYLTKRKRFAESEIRLTEGKDERTITLPEILLDSPSQ
jgi:hypothetical protein